MRHVAIAAGIGLVLGVAGVVAALAIGGLGPIWYPVAVALTGPPCTLLGGALDLRRQISLRNRRFDTFHGWAYSE